MTEKLIFRKETPNDFKEVFEVNQIAFKQPNEAELVNALRHNKDAFVSELSIVATENYKIVGHILFTKLKIKDEKGTINESLGLAPMAVLPELQKKGIGSQLVKSGLEKAKNLGFKSVIVLGHENYYPKFGFEPADKWNINAPFDVPKNAFMAIELQQDGLKDVSGVVIYPKEFDAV